MHFGYYSTFQNLDKGLIEKFGSTGLVTVSFNAVFGSAMKCQSLNKKQT
jgi:hypothetical protein